MCVFLRLQFSLGATVPGSPSYPAGHILAPKVGAKAGFAWAGVLGRLELTMSALSLTNTSQARMSWSGLLFIFK